MAGAADKAPEVKMISGIVARGRTVVTAAGRVGPGGEVSLPADEYGQLKALGFIVDPEAEEIPEANGPTFERG